MLDRASEHASGTRAGSPYPSPNSGRHLRSREVGWKPVTFSRLALIGIITVTLVLIAALGVLLWQNTKYGGVIFTSTVDDFSDSQVFLFRYLPVIITVVYGLFWGWLDLDIKRLEPYYQLSRPGGASATNSLTLSYPSTFFAFAPYTSAKSGHWNVFVISIVTIVMAWFVTPLQNGVFITKNIVVNGSTQVSSPYVLTPLPNQFQRMNGAFLYDASGVLWLGQQPPPFTTRDFALAPFEMNLDGLGFNRTVRGKTTLYEADIDCKTPTVFSYGHEVLLSGKLELIDDLLGFDDGQGCKTAPTIDHQSLNTTKFLYSASYIGTSDDPQALYSLQGFNNTNATCTQAKDANKFVIVWRKNNGFKSDFTKSDNATALFCQVAFYSQEVDATVTVPGGVVQDVSRLSTRRPLSNLIFNNTRFTEMVHIGGTPLTEHNEQSDLVGGIPLGQRAYTDPLKVRADEPITGLALGPAHLPLEQYFNTSNLADAYRSAYRLTFALAAHSLMDQSAFVNNSAATASASFEVVTIVPVIVILVQIFLAIVVGLAAYLMIKLPKRQTRLEKDPDCIAENMWLAHDPNLRASVRVAYSKGTRMPTFDSGLKFALEHNDTSQSSTLVVHGNATPFHRTRTGTNVAMKSVEPIEYAWYIGTLFTCWVLAILLSLVVLNAKVSRDNGLRLPSSNDFALNIITNVLPTAVATLIEPTWVWLCRMACILTPAEKLQRRHRYAKDSLSLNYAALPPQLTMWRAYKNKDYLLGILTSMSFVAAIVTVVISGIFNISDVKVAADATLPALYSAEIPPLNGTVLIGLQEDNDQMSRAFTILLPNMTNSTSLPIWASQELFFFPLKLTNMSNRNDVDAIELKVPGYAIEPQCTELLPVGSGRNNTYQLTFEDTRASNMTLRTFHQYPNGSSFSCWRNQVVYGAEGSGLGSEATENATTIIDASLGKKLGFNFGIQMYNGKEELDPTPLPANYSPEDYNANAVALRGGCGTMNVYGWVRAEIVLAPQQSRPRFDNKTSIGNTTSFGNTTRVDNKAINLNSTLMVCTPRVVTYMAKVRVTTQGIVLSADKLDEPSSAPLTSSITDTMYTAMRYFKDRPALGSELNWQNTSIPMTIHSYLQSKLHNTTAFLDPSKPPPSISTQLPIVSDLMNRFFVASMVGSLTDFPSAPSTAPAVSGTIFTTEKRIFISAISFNITIALLSLQVLVAGLYFFTRPRPFLKRLPTSLAAQISLFANSQAIDDVMFRAHGNFKELDRQGWKYAYGKFIGVDGNFDEGIHRAEYAVSLGRRPTGFQTTWNTLFEKPKKDISNPIPQQVGPDTPLMQGTESVPALPVQNRHHRAVDPSTDSPPPQLGPDTPLLQSMEAVSAQSSQEIHHSLQPSPSIVSNLSSHTNASANMSGRPDRSMEVQSPPDVIISPCTPPLPSSSENRWA